MNKKNLDQIFDQYIERFDFINGDEHQEYFKWRVCHEYPKLMRHALSVDDELFPQALKDVAKSTSIIIDNRIQPFAGLVRFAQKEPSTVRGMFIDLYSDDGGDLKIRMEKIADFLNRSNDLLERLGNGRFNYSQNSHSVSAYLFLNDPDHHYMYKANQSRGFAECVEFYDDWGTGDNIKLDVYYRMCDELVSYIKECSPLIKTDNSRFDGRLKLPTSQMHPDTEKHILAFDIIYCCTVYKFFDGVTYTKRNKKEKNLYLAEKAKAESLMKSYKEAERKSDELDEALNVFRNMVSPGDTIIHVAYGEGIVDSIDEQWISATYKEKPAKISLPIGIANDQIIFNVPEFKESQEKYRSLLRQHSSIRSH